ncbi:Lysine acetyltransferase [Madurella mycetomatis]|uniref:Lysine acetyltransferase n=1 Tax=Madurella mycetomatis TaxID=100816 RepID=A0A175VSM6_9PEZI|nr:Lysine acetyltransferase [Madurella mycetomatis]
MAQPMGLTSSDVVFCEATPEQRQLTWELNGEAWAAPMSLGDYVEREQYLAQEELNRGGGCRYWVLYLKGYPRQIIASCEATRKPALISDGGGGPAREGYGYAVTNVYTHPTWRRQGMAAFLLRRVQEQMDADGDFSILYSGSGRNYYANLGWPTVPSRQATLVLLPSPSPSQSQSPNQTPTSATNNNTIIVFRPSNPSRTRALQPNDLPDLCELDELHLNTRFDSLLPADKKTHVAFLPTHASISWHLARSAFDARKLFPAGNAEPASLNVGAITASGRAWVYWAHDWRAKRLRVLRIARAAMADELSSAEERVGDVGALLEAALAEAARCGLAKGVVVWNPDEEVTLGCKAVGNAYAGNGAARGEGVEVKVVFNERLDGGIPSLRWKGGKGEGLVWEENYGYCWC